MIARGHPVRDEARGGDRPLGSASAANRLPGVAHTPFARHRLQVTTIRALARYLARYTDGTRKDVTRLSTIAEAGIQWVWRPRWR